MKLAWAVSEHELRQAAIAAPDEREDFRLAGIAGASWAAGLVALMAGGVTKTCAWLTSVPPTSTRPAGGRLRPIAGGGRSR